jgi:hypothetical protein
LREEYIVDNILKSKEKRASIVPKSCDPTYLSAVLPPVLAFFTIEESKFRA